MLELVHNLQTALSQRIDEATWMSAATKAQAKDKLENFIIKIGYPLKISYRNNQNQYRYDQAHVH